MPSLNMPVQRLKVAILPLELPCSGPVTHPGEILTTGKSHGKKSDRSLKMIFSYCFVRQDPTSQGYQQGSECLFRTQVYVSNVI